MKQKLTDWDEILKDEFQKPYMKSLKDFLEREEFVGKKIFPNLNEIFAAFDMTPFYETKVVILGQDPYIKRNQAHGLAFSVKKGESIPPSLKNIFKELNIKSDNGCLRQWAVQGVLLLNTVLTVEEGRSKSHKGRGWERFTDKVIEILNNKKEHMVFILWGKEAQKKGKFIDRTKHLVLETSHPSPLSVNKGFQGCKHFDLCNAYLVMTGQKPIDWKSIV